MQNELHTSALIQYIQFSISGQSVASQHEQIKRTTAQHDTFSRKHAQALLSDFLSRSAWGTMEIDWRESFHASLHQESSAARTDAGTSA